VDDAWLARVGERIRYHCLLGKRPRSLTYRDFLEVEPALTRGMDEYVLCAEALRPIARICVDRREPILSVLLGSNLTGKPEGWITAIYREMGDTVPVGAAYRAYVFAKRTEAANYWTSRAFLLMSPSSAR
jgi:hypothetical protein